jgi:putative chitinase
MTPGLLAACTGCQNLKRAEELAPFFTATMVEFEIDTPARQAAYLAQVGHESGGLMWLHELWGPTPTQRSYDPPGGLSFNLGNTKIGDGFRFRGRGPIQITGRFNMRKIGEFMKLDLENHPELLDNPENACRSSGAFWRWKGCNVFADTGDFIGLTKRINGGMNGLADRQTRWAAAKLALGIKEKA